jgi:hypothetical protein
VYLSSQPSERKGDARPCRPLFCALEQIRVFDSMTMSAPWTRVNLVVQTNQKAREKGADMLIIDSLLVSRFFSLGEVRRTLSLFLVAQAQAAMVLTARGTAHSLEPS